MNPSPSDPQRLRKCDSLWYEDGTIVLQADSTLFKVFRGILAAESSVFQDMLSVGKSDTGETYEGCPLVRLYDSSADLEFFLKALMNFGCVTIHSQIR